MKKCSFFDGSTLHMGMNIPSGKTFKAGYAPLVIFCSLALLLISCLGLAACSQPTTQSSQTLSSSDAQATHDAKEAATIYAQTTIEAQGYTPGHSGYLAATAGTPVLQDSLQTDSSHQWDTNANCTFNNGYIATLATQNALNDCIANGTAFQDFTYQVQMKIVQGTSGGLFFRVNSGTGTFYFFTIDSTGMYQMFYYTGSSAADGMRVAFDMSHYFHTGLNQSNEITLIVQGGTMDLYINGQYENRFYNLHSSTGSIGLGIANNQTTTQVQFTNVKVWKLPAQFQLQH